MSIPIDCPKCGDFIGSAPSMSGMFGTEFYTWGVFCKGKGKHTKPERIEKIRFFKLIKKVTMNYPETCTSSSWGEYCGPPKKYWLWFAIRFGTKRWPNGSSSGLIINHEWAWADPWFNCFGKGWEELNE